MKDFFQSQIDEIRENKLRFGLLVACLIGTIIYAVYDSFDSGEEINLDTPSKIVQVDPPTQNVPETNKTVIVSSDKVKAVIGANSDEIYIYDPFKNPTPPTKVEEKIPTPIPPTESVIVPPPTVDEDKFFLRGIALGDNKTAMIEKISNGKSEMLFLQIGEKIKGKVIVDISQDFIILDDGNVLYVE